MRVTDRGIPGDYSPDGTQIVFMRGDPNGPAEQGALFVVNTDGGGLRRITPRGFANGFTGGSWSPDGRWILFEHRGYLFEVHPGGTGLRQIPLADGRADPSPSRPDGLPTAPASCSRWHGRPPAGRWTSSRHGRTAPTSSRSPRPPEEITKRTGERTRAEQRDRPSATGALVRQTRADPHPRGSQRGTTQ